MLDPIEIAWYHWVGFILAVLVFLALDLGVFHKKAHAVKFKEALAWTTVWCVLAVLFGISLIYKRSKEEAIEFITGYVIELSLSMDNVFVIALIFSYFRIPMQYQHRVLFWGILGALIMRGVMIGMGAALIAQAHWVLYIFAVFLVFTGIKMLFSKEEGVHPDKNPLIRLAKKFCLVSTELKGQNFTTIIAGRRALTPLFLVLLMVETTDLIFALDSIPAIFAVTTKPFIVFTSNVFAILGLRSLYFVLAGAIEYFRYLKFGLSMVLIYIGVKMLIAEWYHIGSLQSLVVVGGIISLAMVFSVAAAWRDRRRGIRPSQH
jgi:tellurite resistance protein TerC